LKTGSKFYFILIILFSCGKDNQFDIQGHRGVRGLMPENSIQGFIKSIDIGVTTIELDVVISRDFKVVVSHEPWISSIICLDSLGLKISDDFNKLNIYKINYDQIKKYDCGSLKNPNFLLQEKIFANKPLLKEVIYEVEKYVEKNDLRTPNYNIEIKSHKEGDDIFHPHFEKFSDLVYSEIIKLLPIERFNIQSFDFRVLKYFNKKYPKIKLSVLVDNNYNPKKNLNDLGFVPHIFSPNFRKLNILDIKYMKSKKIKIIPWTVNSYNDITEVLKLNVDGIISDYPERVINTIE
tara:strand:- start:1081 stop:1959 length:879 start_codon:yes stop_codon:yes gene_type:complete